MNNTQLFIGLVCFLLSSSSLLAQGTQVEFGKNRVQYHRDFDEWSQYESDNFIVMEELFNNPEIIKKFKLLHYILLSNGVTRISNF